MRRPVVEAVLAIACLSFMDAVIKAAVATMPVVQVAFLRYVVGSIVMIAIVSIAKPGWPRPDTIRANAVRAVLVVVTATSFFYGLGVLPLAEALILSFLSPVFTAIFAVLLLGERLDLRIASALAAGFAGVLVIVLGGAEGRIGGGSVLGVAAILLSSVTYAASNVLLRARALRDPLLLIVLVQNVAPGCMLAVPAALLWQPLGTRQALLMLVIGLLGVAGHLLLARAYAAVEAVRLAPIDYTALLWAVLIGFTVFGEVPTVWAALGAVLILMGAFAATRRPVPLRKGALSGPAKED